jgi:hypothetical protein
LLIILEIPNKINRKKFFIKIRTQAQLGGDVVKHCLQSLKLNLIADDDNLLMENTLDEEVLFLSAGEGNAQKNAGDFPRRLP